MTRRALIGFLSLFLPILACAEGMFVANWPLKYNASGSTITVSNFPAVQTISGSVSMSNLPAVQTITPLTAASSIMTMVVVSSVSAVVVPANPSRKGLVILNASAQTLYISYDLTATAAKHATTQIAAQGTWVMPYPIYLGPISAVRTSGSDAVDFTELN